LLMVATAVLGNRRQFGLEPLANVAAPDVGDVMVVQPRSRVPLFRWAGLTTIAPIAVYCQNFQIGVPSLLEPLANKRSFSTIFGVAVAATFAMYSTLAFATVIFFGADIDPSCNLNWRSYSFVPISLVVGLFPAIDCISIFPMNAIFLANNLMAVVFGERWHAGNVPRTTRIVARLLCAVPPFLLALTCPSLVSALDFTGIVGIVLPFIVTPLLHRASLRECHAHWGAESFDKAERRAGFTTIFSSPGCVAALSMAGAALLLFCVVSGILYGF